jgi:hypothetical protein
MVKSYQITAVGASHTRKEYENGEPVGERTRAQKEEDRKSKKVIGYKRYGYGDVIKLEDHVARAHAMAHLKLRQTTGTTAKKASEPVKVPADWEQLAPASKRSLAAKISGKDTKRINVTDAEKIIRDHLATLPIGDVGGEADSETDNAADAA